MGMKTGFVRGILAGIGILIACAALPAKSEPPVRPAAWAQPIVREGLPNFHRVSDALYRGAQPETKGFLELQGQGIRTIVNLRSFHSDAMMITGLGMSYEHIYMKAWHPEDEDIVRFLKMATDPARTPVFVHCMHGADRTGLLCAIYRVAVQGWTKDEAIREMTEGGFGYHEVWTNIIKYLGGLDIDSLKKRAGL